MQITLVAYAVLSDMISDIPFVLEVSEGTTAEQLMRLLAEKYPQADKIIPYTRLGCRDDYVDKTTKLVSQQEYSLIPPISGG
ncbi:MoaD/ThiS family protein [Deltaproteobacteria bacterium TL4]